MSLTAKTTTWLLKPRPLALAPTSSTAAKAAAAPAALNKVPKVVKSRPLGPTKSSSVASDVNRNDRLPAKILPVSIVSLVNCSVRWTLCKTALESSFSFFYYCLLLLLLSCFYWSCCFVQSATLTIYTSTVADSMLTTPRVGSILSPPHSPRDNVNNMAVVKPRHGVAASARSSEIKRFCFSLCDGMSMFNRRQLKLNGNK